MGRVGVRAFGARWASDGNPRQISGERDKLLLTNSALFIMFYMNMKFSVETSDQPATQPKCYHIFKGVPILQPLYLPEPFPCQKSYGIGFGRHTGYRAHCSLAKYKSRKIGSVELWRDLGSRYSANFMDRCHTHVHYVDTSKPVEQHVPLAKVLDQD